MPSLAQLARQGGYYGQNAYGTPNMQKYGAQPFSGGSSSSPFSAAKPYTVSEEPSYGTNAGGTYGTNSPSMPMGSPFSNNRFGGYGMANHNRPTPQQYNPTYGQQMAEVGQQNMQPAIQNFQNTAQTAFQNSGLAPIMSGPTGAAAEWQAKYGNFVKNLSGGFQGPDTANTGVLSQKQAPLFQMISNGLGAGKSVAEMEGMLSSIGYVPDPTSPYGWKWGGAGPEPSMNEIWTQANPAKPWTPVTGA